MQEELSCNVVLVLVHVSFGLQKSAIEEALDG